MKTEHKYTVTLNQQLLLLGPVLITNLILIGLYLYFFGWNLPTSLFYYVFIFRFLTDILPVMIVHGQYLIQNGNATLVIDMEQKVLQYKINTKSIEYSFNDIQSLHYYVSYGRGSGWYSFEVYRYFRIVFNDQSEIIITCLMINRIEKKLDQLLGIKADKHLKVLAII
jgi:hypothetical protein